MVKTNKDKETDKKKMPVKSAPTSSKSSQVTKKPSPTAKTASKETPKNETKKVGATKSKIDPTVKAAPKAAAKPKADSKSVKLKGNSKVNILAEKSPELQVTVKQEIIVEPTPGAQPKIEIIPILQQQVGKAPAYCLNEEIAVKASEIEFSKIIPQEDMLKALSKANYKHTDENMQKILQAVLRGSDVFASMPDFNSSYLVGAIGSAYKVLSGALTRVEAKQPLALVLVNNEKKLNELFTSTTNVFPQLCVHFEKLSENTTEDEKKILAEKHIDVLFSTVQALENLNKSHALNLGSVGLCFAYNLQDITNQSLSLSSFEAVLKLLPQERVQKVFLANENVPKAREVAFKYLDDVEYFYLLPCYVKDRAPKQFGHALTVTQKFQVLLGHLKHHKPACAAVFANTRAVAEWIAYKLHGNGIKVELITSSLNFSKKQNLLKSIQSGDVNVIITTDYHTTSLGIEGLNCLYQFDLPDSAEKFIDRLNLIEKSKSPISVSFICEDYGYNMGKIEDKLGFKIHIVHPDKDYFNIKDVSEYPLEADGRVKRIGQVYSVPTVAAPAVISSEAKVLHTNKQDSSTTLRNDNVQQAKMQPRPTSSTPTSTFVPKASYENHRSQNKFENKPVDKYENKPQNKFENKYQDKFIRRDDKAKEALDAARQAAQEKRNIAAQQQNKNEAKKNILSLAVYIVQDAFKAATSAAKQSISTNIEQNLSLFSNILNKVPFLKRDKE